MAQAGYLMSSNGTGRWLAGNEQGGGRLLTGMKLTDLHDSSEHGCFDKAFRTFLLLTDIPFSA